MQLSLDQNRSLLSPSRAPRRLPNRTQVEREWMARGTSVEVLPHTCPEKSQLEMSGLIDNVSGPLSSALILKLNSKLSITLNDGSYGFMPVKIAQSSFPPPVANWSKLCGDVDNLVKITPLFCPVMLPWLSEERSPVGSRLIGVVVEFL